MYKLDLPIDEKEAFQIERRRIREDNRKSRIFNSKIRQIGIDSDALNQQINEKRLKEKLENDRDNLYASAAIRMDKISILFEKRQQDDLKELNKALNEFRFLHQKPEQRREYDLYDPEFLKKDKPARISDDDPRCGISSIQKFDGEDLNNKGRQAIQREQMKNWLGLQISDKQKMIDVENQSKRLYDLKQIEFDKRACDLMESEEDCRRAIKMALSNYNEALSNEKAAKEKLRLQHEEDDKRNHIINALMSDLLTENPNQSMSAFGSHRIIPDRFKGMSKDQLQQIHDTQKRQINEKQLMLEREKEMNELFDKQRIAQARSGLLIEREISRQKQILDKKLADENIKLSKSHQAMMDHYNKEIYTNQPTAAYFMQFNTCSR